MVSFNGDNKSTLEKLFVTLIIYLHELFGMFGCAT
jgi:hypothetical protein